MFQHVYKPLYFTLCLMNINNAFDTNLMLLALDFFLQAGGVKAKLQVVSLKRSLFVTGSKKVSAET